jgi:hypothetical protein
VHFASGNPHSALPYVVITGTLFETLLAAIRLIARAAAGPA